MLVKSIYNIKMVRKYNIYSLQSLTSKSSEQNIYIEALENDEKDSILNRQWLGEARLPKIKLRDSKFL